MPDPDGGLATASSTDDLGIVDALAQLSFLVQEALARRAAQHGLSMVQVRLLGILRDRSPGVNQLAARLDLDKSSVSGLVDRAERRRLVDRLPSDTDRRAVRVELSDSGRTLVETVAREFEADVIDLVGGLSAEQQRTLSGLASAVVGHAEARLGPDRTG